ncbi:MAG: L-serine ammonia-lyase, iron-sulfur-dependent, subunit alpha [Bacteroidales bacterium]
MTKERELEIIELIHNEVKPALGCTEPIAVALAVARSCEALHEIGVNTENLSVEVSANILKNGMGVGIPGTGMIGLHIASALGVTCGKSQFKLEVLKDLDEKSILEAKEMVLNKAVKISLADTPVKLYIEATAFGGTHKATTIIKDNHDSIVSVVRDGKQLLLNVLENENFKDNESSSSNPTHEKTTLDYKLTVKEILEFAQVAEFSDIKFILDSVKLNKALALEGLRGNYGLKVGKTIASTVNRELFGTSILIHAMASTAAASDARMAGCILPAMSNSGSGNQGITVTMPVIAFAEKMSIEEEQLARALILSHLIAIHIKGYLGKLSALCGCVIASTGSSCGIVYLKGGEYKQVCSAIKNMIGNITGMVCDGAKEGCALKVASGVSSAVQAAILAIDNICISSNDGIIDEDIEKTIHNLGAIGSQGMQETDKMILNIMVCK